jgi:predicted lipid-binding transport protein (Tim44 family)
MTPQTAPAARPMAPQQAPAGSGFFSRSPFMSGLMGGLIGAGIGGLLFGGGMFHGMAGFSGFLGFLIQVALVVIIGRLIWNFFARRNAQPLAAGPAGYADGMDRFENGSPMGGGGGNATPALNITPADFNAFEEVLHGVQAAWSTHDLTSMRRIASPEMVSYFAEQMAEQTSRGVRNLVGDVHLEQGDLADAWAEPGREYARVAMRFSMIDVTRDAAGRVVDGDAVNRSMATEVWTFLRAPGGTWVLSAIQQTR